MAVLVGVLAPQFLKYVERSKKSTDVQNVASIVTAIQTYAADPMATTALTNDETITLNTTSTTVADACSAAGAEAALTDAGITNIQLKSSNWGTGDITLTVKVSNGVVTVVESGLSGSQSILKGTYN